MEGPMTREALLARIAKLKADRESTRAQAENLENQAAQLRRNGFAFNGAIEDNEFWLDLVVKAEQAAAKEVADKAAAERNGPTPTPDPQGEPPALPEPEAEPNRAERRAAEKAARRKGRKG